MIELGYPLAPDPELLSSLLGEMARTGRWSNGGPIVAQLEEVLANDLRGTHAMTAASGTTALTMALLACGLPEGGEVITTPLTFVATAHAIEAAGLVPVFAGVNPDTLMLDAAALKLAVTPRTVAIVPVHLMGLAADLALDEIAKSAELSIVYDAAHAYGLPGIADRGTAAAYSLHATKLLHSGEGGAVTTHSAEMADRVRQIRNFGLIGDRSPSRGVNGKMSEIAAATGLAVHARLGAEIQYRSELRAQYEAIVAASDQVHAHAPGLPRALVCEAIRCNPAEQQQILADLAAESVIGRRFPALTSAGQRYEAAPIIGADRQEIDQLAKSLIALPLHGQVTQQGVSAIARALGAPEAGAPTAGA